MRKLAAAVFVLSCVFFAGCGNEEQVSDQELKKLIEADGKLQADVDGNEISVKSKDGKWEWSAGEGVKVPDDFPKDIFIYPNASVTMSSKDRSGFILMLQTEDKPDEVVKRYKKELAGKEWEEDDIVKMGTLTNMNYSKGDTDLTVVVNTSPKGTIISLTSYSEK